MNASSSLSWAPGDAAPFFTHTELTEAAARLDQPLLVVTDAQRAATGLAFGGSVVAGSGRYGVQAMLPAARPEGLGDEAFRQAHGLRYAYVAGEMATGIATADIVIAMARAGCLGFFGAGGLAPARIEVAIDAIEAALGEQGLPWGSNLIHNMHDSAAENAVADLYLHRGVRRVCASAFLRLTPAVVRYACSGLTQDAQGRIVRANHLFAKVSRPEVALPFMSPPPGDMLNALLAHGHLNAREAELAMHLPLAQDITVEADSGGHTDNRPLTALMPTLIALAQQTSARLGYAQAVRVGAAGGLGTPSAVAAAFALGAAYVVTGSVNQAAPESGQSAAARALLAQASLSDVAMAPAADMFELGAKVQVLKRGTMFAVRAQQLYELYRRHACLEAIPAPDRQRLEKDLFRAPLEDIWAQTQSFFAQRDPSQLAKAQQDSKHRMALVFRWYLGQASRWAMNGVADRVMDYQVWCGPAMGAFNAWTRGSFLEDPQQRGVVQIARNLMSGAATVLRAQQLRGLGVPLPASAFEYRPCRFS